VEEKIIKVNGHDILLRVHIVEPLTRLYRAVASYKGYENAPVKMHDDKDKELASDEAVKKLFQDCPPSALEFL
jgi:hypothetical protein